MKYTCLGIICIFAILPFVADCQSIDSSTLNSDFPQKLSEKYIRDMGTRSADYQEKMQAGTLKYLDKLKSQEQILQQQLGKINTDAARIFTGSEQEYDKLQNDIQNNSENVLKSCGKYVPGIDSAITS